MHRNSRHAERTREASGLGLHSRILSEYAQDDALWPGGHSRKNGYDRPLSASDMRLQLWVTVSAMPLPWSFPTAASPPTPSPVANSAVNPRATRNLHSHCCARVLRAPKNFHFLKSHPHSVNPHFALRAVARKTPRARSATDNREERYMMLDHTHVHSCFGIHSSFDLRISSFTQAFGSLPNPPGTPWDAAGTQRDRSGLIGTALGPEKDGFLSPLADAPGRITTLQTASYVSGPRNHTPPNSFFPAYRPQPATPAELAPWVPASIPARSVPGHGEIQGRFRGRFGRDLFQPHPTLDKLTTHFQGNLYAWHPPTPAAPNVLFRALRNTYERRIREAMPRQTYVPAPSATPPITPFNPSPLAPQSRPASAPSESGLLACTPTNVLSWPLPRIRNPIAVYRGFVSAPRLPCVPRSRCYILRPRSTACRRTGRRPGGIRQL
jgi:hypothetical protein